MKVTKWKLLLPLALLVAAGTVATSGALATPAQSGEVKVAIMTDCKGAFASAFESDIGGAFAAFAQYAGGKPKNQKKPSAGITGIKAGGKSIRIVGIGCGDDTAPTALKETRRLMQQLKADVMVGPLSGDEAVVVANYAKTHLEQTFIIGTAGSQDPTLQIAPKNMFRYHGDGAQWNAGLGEVLFKKAKWRTAAIIMDDYSFGWTSAAGIIADFCAVGGKITKRVFPPLNTTDYAPFVRQLPAPNQVDGYIWVIGGSATGTAVNAFEQAHGQVNGKQHSGNLFLWSLENFQNVAPRMVGAYAGGFGTAPGLKTKQVTKYEAVIKKWYPSLAPAAANGFVYNYYNAAWALVQGLTKSKGALGAKLQASMPRSIRSGYEVSDKGLVKLDRNRQAIQDQYQGQIIKNADGSVGVTIVSYAPNVDQSFGGLFTRTSPPPGRTQPKCVKKKLPWQGKVQVVKNGVITKQFIK